MVSAITDRVAAAVAGAPVSVGGYGIIQCTDVSGTNTILAETAPTITQYTANQYFSIRPFAANSGAVTLNLEGLGAKDWLKPDGTALGSGDLSPNIEYLIKYTGTAFRTVSGF